MRPKSVPAWRRCVHIVFLQVEGVVQRSHLAISPKGRGSAMVQGFKVDRLKVPVPISTSKVSWWSKSMAYQLVSRHPMTGIDGKFPQASLQSTGEQPVTDTFPI